MRLLALVVRRCLWMPPTLLGLVLIVFTVSHVIPADPARVMAGENAPKEQVEALRHQYGLDLPLAKQFLRYVGDVARGNMGISLYTQRPIADGQRRIDDQTPRLAVEQERLPGLLRLAKAVRDRD